MSIGWIPCGATPPFPWRNCVEGEPFHKNTYVAFLENNMYTQSVLIIILKTKCQKFSSRQKNARAKNAPSKIETVPHYSQPPS